MPCCEARNDGNECRNAPPAECAVEPSPNQCEEGSDDKDCAKEPPAKGAAKPPSSRCEERSDGRAPPAEGAAKPPLSRCCDSGLESGEGCPSGSSSCSASIRATAAASYASCAVVPCAALGVKPAENVALRRKWTKIGYGLAATSVIYNVFEAIIAVFYGLEAESVALRSFGLEGIVEVVSALVVVWRLRGDFFGEKLSPQRAARRLEKERKATRVVGCLLCVFGGSAVIGGIVALVLGCRPQKCPIGLAIAAVNLSLMALLYAAKIRAASVLDSRTLSSDARCTFGCGCMSMVVLVSSALYLALPGAWWVDASAAMVIGLMLCRDGTRAIAASLRQDFKGGCPCGH